ncbi:NADH-quinone oxidoreductase subunit NuoF [Candidatus Bipolaricaulota bacterium]|nr:NADH-quinone oxidoreductase subunit NuoF [Candidatus Bipolaricaulota bacterium]
MRIARAHVLVGVDEEARLAGVDRVISALREGLSRAGLEEEVQVVETGTLGVSGRGVVLVVYPEGVYYAGVTPEDIPQIVEEHLLKGRPVERLRLPAAVPQTEPRQVLGRQVRVVLRNCGVIDPEEIEEYIAAGGYAGLERALRGMTPEEVLGEIKRSGLRGRGGAGFPTGIKWEAVRRAPGQEKYVICNADEWEPGTFKDRLILEGDPHKLIEGMLLCGYAVGAKKGFIYIRGEYALSIARMQRAISQAREYGLLGEQILGTDFSFDLEVRPGAGAYVCGEETSLIESLEGKRGWPRIRPPYPVTCGLWGRPTVVNNVETLASVPEILRQGADWYRTLGTPTCPGTKVYTILGHVRFPGLVEVEMGTPLRALVYELGGGLPEGRRLKGVLVGGAAGAFLSPQDLDVRMDFDSLRELAAALGSGAVLVMDQSACMVDMLASVLRFFRHESCGQCTPCRAGTDVLVRLVEAIRRGEGDRRTLDLILETVETMSLASLCPLGQSVALPVKTCLSRFREEFEVHLSGEPCPHCREPQGVYR